MSSIFGNTGPIFLACMRAPDTVVNDWDCCWYCDDLKRSITSIGLYHERLSTVNETSTISWTVHYYVHCRPTKQQISCWSAVQGPWLSVRGMPPRRDRPARQDKTSRFKDAGTSTSVSVSQYTNYTCAVWVSHLGTIQTGRKSDSLLKLLYCDRCCGALQAVSVLWNCLAYFNSCVNPIIYNRTSKEFRDAFLEASCCGRRASNRSEWTQMHLVDDGRNLATRLTIDDRRHASCTTIYTPSRSASPSPAGSTRRSNTGSSQFLSPYHGTSARDSQNLYEYLDLTLNAEDQYLL